MIETARLRLRPWTDEDLEPWIAMMTDPDVMRYVVPEPITRAGAERAARHYREELQRKGYGWWPIEVKGGTSFGGIILLQDVPFTAAFTPAVEVGWLLPREQWGKGLATEGARAVLDHAFGTLNLAEVVALTAAGNLASQRVMQRLGMTHDSADDFDHPRLSGHPLQHCVLYRMKCPKRGD
jgi:ribosomal-protein-alanine N-acetyltransferase